MEMEKILKLCLQKYGTPDNLIGKNFLLREKPEIKELMVHIRITEGDVYRISKAEFNRIGIDIQQKQYLQYTKKDFPELWTDKE